MNCWPRVLAHRPGVVDLQLLKEGVNGSAKLVRTERGCTTKEILETELSLIQTVNAGCDAVKPLHPGYRPADWLGEDQRRAIYHVLRTSDRITGLRGILGGHGAKRRLCASWPPPAREAGLEPL